MQAVCSGFVYALAIADLFMRSGNAATRWWSAPRSIRASSTGTTAALACCSATAPARWCSLRANSPGILATQLHADGSYAGILSVPGQVCGGSVRGQALRHDGRQRGVQVRGARARRGGRRKCCAATISTRSAIDWLIPHQANIRIIEATARKLGLPMSKVVVTVDRHANTSAASIPLALDEAVRDGRIRPASTSCSRAWAAALPGARF